MAYFFGDHPVWRLIAQADAISTTVLLSLLCLSIICWALFMGKALVTRVKKRQLDVALAQMTHARTVDDLVALSHRFAGTMPGAFITRSLALLKTIIEMRTDNNDTHHEIDQLEEGLVDLINTAVSVQESYVPVLSTCATVAPLLGLFGTVWGLIHAFIRMSEHQAADIITVAPGIAEALITTLAGLIVAIPALIMYNYLSVQSRVIEQKLSSIAVRITFISRSVLKK